MASLTIDLDDETLSRLEAAAVLENMSLSDWVKKRLDQIVNDQWPVGYFDLFGALGDVGLQRPPQPDL